MSSFDTSKVSNFSCMLNGCSNLKYLDLSNFKTSNAINLNYTFQNCSSLIYLDLFSFQLNNSVNKVNSFTGISPFVKYCINDLFTKNFLIGDSISNCSDICFNKPIKLDINENQCIESCFDNGYKFEHNNICYDKCPRGTLLNNNICLDNKCNGYNPNINECSENTPFSYYYDLTDEIYKKCYEKCLLCYGPGNETYNNCIKCKFDLIILNDSIHNTKCYEKCEFFYYFDEFNDYHCTENYTCPDNYNKLILNKNKCIDECKNDNIYKFEYENRCFLNCPNNLIYNESNICYEDNTIETSQNYFINQTINYDIIETVLINTSNINLTKYEMIKNIENFRNSLYDFNVSENKEDKVEVKEGIIYQMTTSENQKNNTNKNISTLDLGDCEKILKEKYEINPSIPLIILKIDYFSPGSSIPTIGYEIYHPLNKSKLDLKYCEDILIKLNIPVSINENELFKYDPNSEFYTDNCFSYTTEDGTDIILNDRKQEFNANNLSLCENNCNYTGYNTNDKQSSCDCNVKNKIDLIDEIFDKQEKSYNFDSDKDSSSSGSSNIITIKCTKALFSKDGLINNISSYILLLFITQFLISIILFIKCGYHLLIDDIDNILKEKEKIKKQNNEKNRITSIGNLSKKKNKKKILSKKKANFPPKEYNLHFINNINNKNKIKTNNSKIKILSICLNKNIGNNRINKNNQLIQA